MVEYCLFQTSNQSADQETKGPTLQGMLYFAGMWKLSQQGVLLTVSNIYIFVYVHMYIIPGKKSAKNDVKLPKPTQNQRNNSSNWQGYFFWL